MTQPGHTVARIPAWFPVVVALLIAPGHAAAQLDAITKLDQQGRYHEIVDKLQPRLDAGQTLSSLYLWYLGNAYYEVRQYRGALATADAMDRNIAAGDRWFFGADLSPYPLINRASVALDLGAYENALLYGSAALERVKSKPQGPRGFLEPTTDFSQWQLIQIHGVLGVTNAFLGRRDAARQDLEAIRVTELPSGGPEKFTAMARIHMALKEYDKALAAINDPGAEVGTWLSAFAGLFGYGDLTSRRVPMMFIRAKCLYETGAYAEAKTAYDELLKLPQISQLAGEYWPSLYDRARIALREGDVPLAVELLKKALEAIEQQRSSIDTEAGRIGFVGDKQAVYRLLVSLLVARGEAAAALDYVERSKARALVDMLASKRDFSVTSDAERVKALLAAADSAELAAHGFESTAEATAAKRGVAMATRQELLQAAPELSSLVSVKAADATTLQGLLPADETLVEYFYGGDELDVFVATPETLSAMRLDGHGLEAEISAFRKAIEEPASSRWQEPAKALYMRVVAPIRDQLRTPNLLVVAHGALHYVPFNALHDDKGFLIESYSIRLLPAATVLEFLRTSAVARPGSILAFGNPDLGDKRYDLPFAQKEAEAVAQIMPRSRALVRGEATRAAFRKYAADFQFIHVASHGLFDAERPLASSLLLAPEGADDGRLTVSDLYSMRVGADLVTLSACETGLGSLANGDDVVGLTRGFLYAGTGTIVASLWQVDDRATSDLMTSFYRSLGKGVSKREALRTAQREQLKRQPHPFFWAAFQLTGSP